MFEAYEPFTFQMQSSEFETGDYCLYIEARIWTDDNGLTMHAEAVKFWTDDIPPQEIGTDMMSRFVRATLAGSLGDRELEMIRDDNPAFENMPSDPIMSQDEFQRMVL